MPIQNYDLYTKNAFRGQIAYASEPRVVVSAQLDDVSLNFGSAVDAVPLTGGVTAGVLANVHGVALRELNHEAKFRPSTGETHYKQTETVSVMREGSFNVEVTADAVTAYQKLFVDAGEFTGATGIESLNVIATESGAIGDIIKARIVIVA